MSPAMGPVVNAWTQWGRLETVVVGKADPTSCHLPVEPSVRPSANDPTKPDWPGGKLKDKENIRMAAEQLENFTRVLEAETVQVKSQKAIDTELKRVVDKNRTSVIESPSCADEDARVVRKHAIQTMRPDSLDWTKPVAGPHWDSPSQYCATCPRDTMITLGNTILEGTMSRRSRYFEHLACRTISLDLWKSDPERIRFLAAPKPSMADSMYNMDFFDVSPQQRFSRQHKYQFCCNEMEPIFDAADIMRCGKDIFVQKSMTTNDLGIKWITSHFPELRVHPVHIPYDMYPAHLDATFVPLRPPSALDGDDGLVLINPERPPLESESRIWKQNGWRFIVSPEPAQYDCPIWSTSSYWLCMNMLSISPNGIIMEENETPLFSLLTDHGFDPITVPMRHMYEFGGAIHCSTWDIKRDDDCKDYFPNQDLEKPRFHDENFSDIVSVNVADACDGLILNPRPEPVLPMVLNMSKRKPTAADAENGNGVNNGLCNGNGVANGNGTENGLGVGNGHCNGNGKAHIPAESGEGVTI